MLFGVATPRIVTKTIYIESIAPTKIAGFFKNLADVYVKRVDVATVMLSPIIRFTASTLLFTYTNSLVVNAVEKYNMPPFIAMASAIISSTAIMIVFIRTLRVLFGNILKYITIPTERLGETLGKALDLLIGGLALALQIHILLETTSKLLPREPLYTLATLFTWLATVVTVILELVKHYIKPHSPHQENRKHKLMP